MKVDVVNMEGKKVRSLDVSTTIFEAPINIDLMHQAYVRQMANARLGTHSTKGRSEVAGGGRKPWRQKGTGRARQGSNRAPQWVGGGKVHKPKPRDYTLSMPRKMRRAALRSALSVKIAEKNVVFLDELTLKSAKTGMMIQALDQLVGNASVLVLLPEKNEASEVIVRCTKNIPDAKTLWANYLNIRDLLNYEKLVIPVTALDIVVSYLGEEKSK